MKALAGVPNGMPAMASRAGPQQLLLEDGLVVLRAEHPVRHS